MTERPIFNIADPSIGNLMWEGPESLGRVFEAIPLAAKEELQEHLQEHYTRIFKAVIHFILAASELAPSPLTFPFSCSLFEKLEDALRVEMLEGFEMTRSTIDERSDS